MENRTLYFGDNLDILRNKFLGKEGYFDLIYLDPPFNSNRNYNILFKEGIVDSPAQVQAFEDSWHWTAEARDTFNYLVEKTNPEIANLMIALERIIGHNDILAYLTMMTVRLVELHRVLKPTGSLYLHCDPTASHYLKIVLDVIFGKSNFRNELVWLYKGRELSHKNYSRKHDIIFFYTKSDKYIFYWDKIIEPLEESSRKALARYKDKKGYFIVRYKKGGGFAPIEKEGKNTYRQYVPEGVPPRDWFYADYARKSEQLGYPTQKPEKLLERIIKASSKEGDWVLDPFCGCGTTVAVAERLNRNWIGIDITTLSINLIKHRINEQFKEKFKKENIEITVDGLPADLSGAKALAEKDRFEFEYWALDLVNAMPAKSKSKEKMRGADRGVDGYITFPKGVDAKGYYQQGKIVVQVKSGKVQRNQIATLKGDVERENADAGLFITLLEPTREMEKECVESGEFKGPFESKYSKIQIITIKELLEGKKPNLPITNSYHKEVQKTQINLKGKQKFLI